MDHCLAKANHFPLGGEKLLAQLLGDEEPRAEHRPIQPQEVPAMLRGGGGEGQQGHVAETLSRVLHRLHKGAPLPSPAPASYTPPGVETRENPPPLA